MKNETILVISGRVVSNNSKIDWPDLNFPDSSLTILRYLHHIDYENQTIQLDGADGPIFTDKQFPKGVGFYTKAIKTS